MDDPACPIIDSEKKAIALGVALNQVLHYDAEWAKRVYTGDPKLTYSTGPDVLQQEIESLWHDGYTSLDERRRITALYVAARLTL